MSGLPDPGAWSRDVAALVKDFVARATAPLEARIAELESAQTKSLADSWQGVWRPNAHYVRGALCTHHGALWLALTDAEGTPGASSSWRLVVKAPR